jgi:hypothetical protein
MDTPQLEFKLLNYLTHALRAVGATEFRLAVQPGDRTSFVLHPLGRDGCTLNVSLPDLADPQSRLEITQSGIWSNYVKPA